jgi:hypothetical protein
MVLRLGYRVQFWILGFRVYVLKLILYMVRDGGLRVRSSSLYKAPYSSSWIFRMYGLWFTAYGDSSFPLLVQKPNWTEA